MAHCSIRGWLFSVVAAMFAALPAAAADIEHGRQLFVTCAACHNDRPGALGPDLKGVVDRKAGAREDYRYSKPMQRSDFVWDETNLRAYLADPQAKVPGNRMPFSGLRDAKDIEDVIAYLATLK
jgi:cytochrome c